MGLLIPLKSFSQISLDCGDYDFLENPGNDTLFVISSLLHVMNNHLPIESLPSTKIIFLENIERPICQRNAELIILNANPNTWNQLAYQLAHEMCHRTIPCDVIKNLRWLEESICELSSYYFLPRLTKYWRRKKVPLVFKKTQKPYYPAFESYVKYDKKKAEPFDLSSLASDTLSEKLQQLINDCEIREMNAHIANEFLPVFKAHPDTWHAVPYLCQIKSDLTLKESLTEWLALSPEESRTGLRKIAQIFGAEISQ